APPAPPTPRPGAPATAGMVTIRDIHRSVLPDGVRITVDLDAEVPYHQEEIANPRRVFFDLKSVKTAPALQDVSLKYDDDIVKEIRLGRHPQNTTRLVVDLDGVAAYSVYPMYGPYRLVMDFRRAVAATPIVASWPVAPTVPAAPPVTVASRVVIPPPVVTAPPAAEPKTAAPATPPPVNIADAKPAAPEPPLLRSEPAGPKSMPPAAPTANSNGKFSLSRQLGLSVSRVVIDAGHGGPD